MARKFALPCLEDIEGVVVSDHEGSNGEAWGMDDYLKSTVMDLDSLLVSIFSLDSSRPSRSRLYSQ